MEDSSVNVVTVARNGVVQGTRSEINLIEGAKISLTVTDDPTNDRVNVTVDNQVVPIGADGYVQYYDSGTLNGNTNFVFTLSLPNPTGVPYPGFIIGTEPAKGGAITTDASLTNGVLLVISAGEANSGNFVGGNLLMFGGGSDAGPAGSARLQGGSAVNSKAGDAILAGGNSISAGGAGWAFVQGGIPETNGDGGHVKLIATQKNGTSVQNGWIYLNTGGSDKLIMTDTGAWFINGSSAGNAGDNLVSSGSGASPSWKPTGLGAETTIAVVSGANNNVDIGSNARIFVSSTAGGTLTLTGFTGGTDGRLILITNVASLSTVILTKEGAGSTAANRIFAGGDTTLSPGGSRMLCYSATLTRWVVI